MLMLGGSKHVGRLPDPAQNFHAFGTPRRRAYACGKNECENSRAHACARRREVPIPSMFQFLGFCSQLWDASPCANASAASHARNKVPYRFAGTHKLPHTDRFMCTTLYCQRLLSYAATVNGSHSAGGGGGGEGGGGEARFALAVFKVPLHHSTKI